MIEVYKKTYNFCEIDSAATWISMIFSSKELSDSYEPECIIKVSAIKTVTKNQIIIQKSILFMSFLSIFSILYQNINLYSNHCSINIVKMTTELITTTKIILFKAEDWEKWFHQLRDHVDKDIWVFLDPDVDEEDEKELIKKSVKLSLRDYNHNMMNFCKSLASSAEGIWGLLDSSIIMILESIIISKTC
jgi:hypothetical protein